MSLGKASQSEMLLWGSSSGRVHGTTTTESVQATADPYVVHTRGTKSLDLWSCNHLTTVQNQSTFEALNDITLSNGVELDCVVAWVWLPWVCQVCVFPNTAQYSSSSHGKTPLCWYSCCHFYSFCTIFLSRDHWLEDCQVASSESEPAPLASNPCFWCQIPQSVQVMYDRHYVD